MKNRNNYYSRNRTRKKLSQRGRPGDRRGILLLIALSMLVLFMMIGTAFVVTARHTTESAKSQTAASAIRTSEEAQARLIDEVVRQIIRDTANVNSSLRFHSLLRDMYGNDGFTARMTSTQWPGGNSNGGVTGGQIFEFQLDDNVDEIKDFFGVTIDPVTGLDPIDDSYNGLVITFVDGPLRGQSSRILDYRPPVGGGTPTPAWFRVLAVARADGSPLPLDTLSELDGTQILVNGRPYNGTGFGYDLTAAVAGNSPSARLAATENVNGSQLELALLPDSRFFNRAQIQLTSGPASQYFAPDSLWNNFTPEQQLMRSQAIAWAGQGGADESYDAADFQNMLLAVLQRNPRENDYTAVAPGAGGGSLGSLPLPSLHRPALYNYWASRVADLEQTPELLRRVLLRPNWIDHPAFDGSNPNYAEALAAFNDDPSDQASQDAIEQRMIYGPWDVDNDSDGVRDSVWVDFGASIIQRPDGKLVKPLAAVLVLDLDGRVNVNAHGALDVVASSLSYPASMGVPAPPPQSLAGVTSDAAPHGQGYGPAEISLAPVLGPAAATIVSGPSGSGSGRPFPGRYGDDRLPGKKENFDLIAQLKMSSVPDVYAANSPRTAYSTPPDYKGRYGVGINEFGQPVYEAWGDTPTGASDTRRMLHADTPYEINLSNVGASGELQFGDDAPYTIAELERVLRAYDADAGTLPPRLASLGNMVTSNLDNRNLLTTDSYDLPAPSIALPAWVEVGPDGTQGGGDDFDEIMRKPAAGATFSDLIEYRIRLSALSGGPPLTLNRLRRTLAMLVPRDLADGLRLDVNRALGNGLDDGPPNGIVDEPGELEPGHWRLRSVGLSPSNLPPASNDFETAPYKDDADRDRDGMMAIAAVDANAIDDLARVELHNHRRQQLARDLFITTLAVVDPYDLNDPNGRQKTRAIAQWAINTVDFRDTDNTVTAFEFDFNPFDGWDVDGWIGNSPGANDQIDHGRPGSDDVPSPDDDQAFRGLVWGVEKPELLITEALAWHDLATEDLAETRVSSGTARGETGLVSEGKDEDFDQLVRPQGGALIELYNPWPQNAGENADTHALSTNGEDLGVNLSAVARDPVDPSRRSPVWRLTVFEQEPPLVADPDDPELNNRPTNPDRTIYFATAGQIRPLMLESNDQNDGAEYFATLPVPSVRPGRYLVVGSGTDEDGDGVYESTIVRPRQSPSERNANPNGPLSARRFMLSTRPNEPHAVSLQDENANPIVNNDPQSPMNGYRLWAPADPAPIDARRSMTDVAIINEPRRFTLSEPAEGYPLAYPDALNPVLKWYGPNTPGMNPEMLRQFPDGFYGTSPNDAKAIDTPLDSPGGVWERGDGFAIATPSASKFRTLYLQRLANPLLPYNPEPPRTGQPPNGHDPSRPVNPYLTVDSSTTTLTVFNGRSKVAKDGLPTGNGANDDAGRGFFSVERGWKNDPANPGNDTDIGPLQANPWTVEHGFDPSARAGRAINPRNPNDVPGPPTRRAIPQQRLGPNFDAFTLTYVPRCTIGFLNDCFIDANLSPNEPEKQVRPKSPFPWLAWNNRPYISSSELLQAPMTRSSQLLRTFSLGLDPSNQKSEAFSGQIAKSQAGYQLDGKFFHQPNFFRADDDNGEAIAGLSRVLEYLHVPSRYVGTETWLNPAIFGGNVTAAQDARVALQPPFNKVSRFRDPGRVNLNTITSSEVWDSLFHGTPNQSGSPGVHPGPSFYDPAADSDFVRSRRGYGTPNDLMLTFDAEQPSFFANPFRTGVAHDLVPLVKMVFARDVDVTKLRASGVQAGERIQNIPQRAHPLFAAQTTQAYNNADRNSYFRYQPLVRLENLTTNRSHVYAVWITIGFFEVEPAPSWSADEVHPTTGVAIRSMFSNDKALYDRVYPDGYMFGRESGIDFGGTKRLRGFYVVDRTIPVGFEAGVNHNAENTIRLRRQIE